MPDITREGATIHYETAGKGPAILFLHPLPHDHTVYLYQIAHFATWFKTIAMDFRGFGRSRASAAPYGLNDLCDDALAVCKAEGVGNAVVLGTSIGSKAALLLGQDHPDFCRAVIAVGAGNKPAAHRQAHIDDYRYRRDAFHRAHLTSVVSPAFARSPLGQYFIATMEARSHRLGMQGDEMARTVAAAHDRDLRPRLPTFRPPLLVINGEFDTSLSGGTETASLVPHARHEIIAGAGHACGLETPAIFNALVLDFLKDCGSAR
jgi:pimeloyl-ACP methyl ester carboxylesterase